MNTKRMTCAGLLLLSGYMTAAQGWQGLSNGPMFNAEVGVVSISVTPSGSAWGVMSTPGLPAAVPYCLNTAGNPNSWSLSALPLPDEHTPASVFGLDTTTAWIASYALNTEDSGRIYKTTDGGIVWTQQATANFRDAARFVHFFNANEGVAIGDTSVFTTVNGGTAWTRQARLPLRNRAVNHFLYNAIEVRNSTIWIGDDASNFYKSTDRGHTWSRINGVGAGYTVTGIAFRDSLNGMATVQRLSSGGQQGGGFFTDDGYFYRTVDGGNTWTQAIFNFPNVAPPNQGRINEAKFDIAWLPGSARTYIITSASASGYSAITTDDGTSWQMIDSGKMHLSLGFTARGSGWSGGVLSPGKDALYRWQAGSTGIAAPAASYIAVWPNPVSSRLSVRFRADHMPVYYEITDAVGRRMQSGRQPADGVSNVSVDVSGLSSGAYLLQLSAGGNHYYSRFLKQ